MDTTSISISNLESGEVYETDLKLSDNRYGIKGYKMYNNGVMSLIDILTKSEMKQTIELFGGKSINYYNVLMAPFHKLTSSMSKAARSRYKHKLLDGGIIIEYNKRIMLNPFIFNSKGDKNIRNCVYLTQRVWKYMVEDSAAGTNEVVAHAELIFGEFKQSDFLSIGKGKYQQFLKKPEIA